MRRRSVALAFLGLLGAELCSGVWLDPTFGRGGIVYVNDNLGGVRGMVIQADGKTVTVGSDAGNLVLMRFEIDGSRDQSFGDGGTAGGFPFPPYTESRGIVALPDGRLVVGGATSSGSFFLARFLPNGALDGTFGSGGWSTLDFPGVSATAQAIAMQPDGKLVLAGLAGQYSPFPILDYAAARFFADGAVDGSFGSAGRVIIDMGGRLPEDGQAVAVTPEGRILIAGLTDSSSGNGCGIAALRSDGSLDPSFGQLGRLFPAGVWGCGAMALDSDGTIFLGGATQSSALVMRLLPDGQPDARFGDGGRVELPFSRPVNALGIDSRGRVAVTLDHEIVFARLLPDGHPDPLVGPAGWTVIPGLPQAPPQNTASASTLALTPTGAIVIGVNLTLVTGYYPTLVRYIEGGAVPVPTLSAPLLAMLAAGLALVAVRLLRGVTS